MSNNTTNNQPKLGPVSQPTKLQKTKDGKYRIQKAVTKDELYDAVLHLIKEDYQREELTSSRDTRTYLKLKMMKYEQEVFAVVFLDSQHRVIAFEELFFGTINAAAVYPREVVKRGLYHNAGAMIFAHNHPSGHCLPSMADKQITKTLIEALALVDIRVLDHVIVGIDDTYSFAETGLI